ncbi:hypothetical protein L600_000300000990 [Isoptericola variabilis J7]|nr:hypothetical protein L600_000300000990 [Isoptericola variabilis J7]
MRAPVVDEHEVEVGQRAELAAPEAADRGEREARGLDVRRGLGVQRAEPVDDDLLERGAARDARPSGSGELGGGGEEVGAQPHDRAPHPGAGVRGLRGVAAR